MRIEHLALNIADPAGAAGWYVAHLGMRLIRSGPAPTHGRFIADDAGVLLELYNDTAAPHLDLGHLAEASFHLALVSHDLDADIARLTAAGAAQIGAVNVTPSGDRLAFLRDPWGLVLQLAQRVAPLAGPADAATLSHPVDRPA